MREEAESARSSKRREVDDRLMNENDPPPYGAQHRQDALWEGELARYDVLGDSTRHQEAMRRSLLGGSSLSWGVMYGIKMTT